jgi:hypothetical protein
MLLNPATLWLSMPAVQKTPAEAMMVRGMADLRSVTMTLTEFQQRLAAQGQVKP